MLPVVGIKAGRARFAPATGRPKNLGEAPKHSSLGKIPAIGKLSYASTTRHLKAQYSTIRSTAKFSPSSSAITRRSMVSSLSSNTIPTIEPKNLCSVGEIMPTRARTAHDIVHAIEAAPHILPVLGSCPLLVRNLEEEKRRYA